jgi:hypothetical protein
MSARALRRRVWLTPALIGIAAVAPVVVAVLLYVHPAWFALGRTNHGRLLNPPVKIHMTTLARPLAGSPLPRDYFHGSWTMVYVGGPHCDPDCREALYVTRQIRLGMGRSIRRVQRLYVVRGTHVPKPKALHAAHPDLAMALAAGSAGQRFAAQFTDRAESASIYLVDPRGLLMMTYPVNDPPLGLLKDLRHLLKANPPS